MISIKKGSFAGLMLSTLITTAALANPTGGVVTGGEASIQQTPNTTTINQTSQRAIINWQSFNIGSQETTHFQQPVDGIALNRISPVQGVSQIFGTLTATGKIILINPAGIYFAPGAYVNVGGLIATTTGISDDKKFMSGQYSFDQPTPYANASIINRGTIIAANHGLVALVGPNVTNSGVIRANLGEVALASGDTFTVDFSGDNMINFAVGQSAHSGSVTNTGSLIANGGIVQITAQQAQSVLDNIINLQGVIEAKSVYKHRGEVIISGAPDAGVVNVAANIDVSGLASGQIGGTVNITGHNILLGSNTVINASGDAGGGVINIGGNKQGKGVLPNANAVVMQPNASLHADAITTGNGGQIVLWSNDYTNVSGNISAQGGSQSGNGGYIETSSGNVLDIANLNVNALAPHGTTGEWLLDPYDVTISTAATSGGSFNGGSPTNTFTPTATANILNTDINNNLATANVTITTTGAGTDAGNITVNAPITWSSTHVLTLQATNDIILNAAISGVNGGLDLSAVNASQSITTSAAGTVNVANFNLLQGQWFQAFNTLPAFNVSNNFQIDSGVMPNTVAQFIRSASATGNGTSANPYVIVDVYGLQGIGSNATTVGQFFNLGSNIDATTTTHWNSGAGFLPIGDNLSDKFNGTLNGQGFAISNLFINQPASTSFTGLIDNMLGTGTVMNLSLLNVDITGNADVGAITGLNQGGTISSTMANGIVITGTVTGMSNFVGGVAGNNSGIISGTAIGDISIGVSVNSSVANSFLGDVTGLNNATLTNVTATGTVTAPNGTSVGGLAGGMQAGTITNSTASGNVTGFNNVGGLIGSMLGGTLNSTALAGITASGNVTATGMNIGGLIGDNAATLAPTAQGDITATGTVTATGANQTSLAGLIGLNSGSISNFTNTIVITSAYDSVGGIVGDNTGMITNSYNSATITGKADVGGIAGSMTAGTISDSYNSAAIVGADSVGGVVGNIGGGSLNKVYNTGTVLNDGATASPSAFGGIAGTLSGSTSLTNAYNTGLVLATQGGQAGTAVGGIIGSASLNTATLGFLYNTGFVQGSSGTGGLIGSVVSGTPTFSGTSYFNTDTSGQSLAASNFSDANLIGATTAQMQTQATFSGWDFATTWNIIAGTSYPYLRDFYTTPTILTSLSSASGATPIVFYDNGVFHDSGYTGADGSAYFLEGANLISGVNNSIANGDSLYLFFNQTSPIVSNAIAIANGQMGFGNALTLASNTLTLGLLTNSGTLDNSTLAAAVNGEPHALFSVSGNNLTLDSGVNFSVTTPTTYNVIGGVTTSGGGTVDLAGSVNGGGNAFDVNVSGSSTISGVISNVSSLIKDGAGVLTLAGANTYNGSTIINSGSVVVTNASGLGSTAGATILNPGTLLTIGGVNIGNENITLNNAELNGNGAATTTGAITLASGTSDVINANSGSLTLGGTIDGAANLTLQGAGSMVLSGNIGSGTPLSSLISNIILTLGGNSAISSNSIVINNGVTGGNNLALTGASISMLGGLSVNNLSITGSGADNSLLLDSGTTQVFNVTGTNTGNITNAGIAGTGSFSNLQNITGSSTANNVFMFANNAAITGLINGGGTTTTNTLDYSAYTTPITITLAANKFNGTVVNGTTTITNYNNFNNLIGNGAQSLLILTTQQLSQAKQTGSLSGFIGDPVDWSNISVNFPVIIPTPTPTPSSEPTPTGLSGADISPIIQQGQINSDNTGGSSDDYLLTSSVQDNIDSLESAAANMFDTTLSNVKINPYCYQNGS